MIMNQVSLTTKELEALEELLARTLVDRVGPDGEIGEGDDEAEHLLGIYTKVDAIIAPPDWDEEATMDVDVFVPPSEWGDEVMIDCSPLDLRPA
jgi:hypothetical protein